MRCDTNLTALPKMDYSLALYLCVSCFLIGISRAEYNYITGDVNAQGVPDGPMDLQPPTFDEMKNFGTARSGDAMENIFRRNVNVSSDAKCFMQGDIPVDCNASGRVRRNALRDRGRRWESNIVPYTIDNRYDYGTRGRIQRAIDRYHATTCLRFVQRTTQRDYISIFPGSGCWSLVGRQGGMQQLSLGTGCTTNLGTIVHELMHAVGFQHEQTRADRDSYVYIYFSNIIQGLEYNFDKYDLNFIDHLGTSYDYFSVMHYHMTAFTVNGQPTIVARDQSVRLDYRSDFSATDIEKINIYYECGDARPTTGPTLPDDGDCMDMNENCAVWAQYDQCNVNPSWMHANCKVSCEICDPTTGGKENCVDMNENCEVWANNDECTLNPSWMLPNCPVSCEQCDTTPEENCIDTNDNCGDWAKYGECTNNPGYMLTNCPRACGQCGGTGTLTTCGDYNDNCAVWAANDQCNANPGYMNYECKKSCNLCTASSPLELLPQLNCEDSNGYCSIFAADGMCTTKPDYMGLICPESCGMCPGQTTSTGTGGVGASWSLTSWLTVLVVTFLTRQLVL